jgi:hypothetical protein
MPRHRRRQRTSLRGRLGAFSFRNGRWLMRHVRHSSAIL